MEAAQAATTPARSSHRATMSIQRTEIIINLYDIMPPGRFCSAFWAFGIPLVHSGVVINGREYAFGGHDREGETGVYSTDPRVTLNGGTFRTEILHGMTFATQEEIHAIILQVSNEFMGPSYDLLTKNCNHFTSYLVQKLTGKAAPAWLNRAASFAFAMPCIIPRFLIEPPEFVEENARADGELVRGGDDYEYDDDDDGIDTHEATRMLRRTPERLINNQSSYRNSGERAFGYWDNSDNDGHRGRGKAPARDSSGRYLPPSERAPVPRP